MRDMPDQKEESSAKNKSRAGVLTAVLRAASDEAQSIEAATPGVVGTCGCGSVCPVCLSATAAIIIPATARFTKRVFRGLQRDSHTPKPVKTKV